MNLTTFHASYKWNHAVLYFLTYFTQNDVYSRFTHTVGCNGISPFCKGRWHSVACVYHAPFIHSLLTGIWVVSASWLLCIVAAVSMGCMNLSESLLSVLLDVFQEVRFLDCTVILFIILRRATVLFPTVVALFHNPTSSWFQFLHILINTCYFVFFFFHPNKSEVIFHCGFDMHFSDDSDVDHLFIWCWSILGEMSIEIFCSFFELFDFFFCWAISILYIFWILAPYQIDDLHIFSPILWTAFHSVGYVIWCSKVFKFDVMPFTYFSFFACSLGVMSKKSLLSLMPWKLFSLFSSWSYIVLSL